MQVMCLLLVSASAKIWGLWQAACPAPAYASKGVRHSASDVAAHNLP